MKAVIPAAGLGTRFLPATKAVPKEMLPIYDKPCIQYVVEEGLDSKADEVVIVNSRTKVAIEEHFTPDPDLVRHLREHGKDALADAVEHAGDLNVEFVYQDEALGLGHAVLCAERACEGEPFYVLLGDVIVLGNEVLPAMQRVSDAHGGASVIAVMPVADDEVDRFGIISGAEIEPNVWKVDSMVEKPPVGQAPSNLAIFGRYLLSPRVMELLHDVEPGSGGEIQLTDAMHALLAEEDAYALVVDPSEGIDSGTIPNWLAANNIVAGLEAK